MAEWNKIPLGLPRPEGQPLERHDLNICVADYLHSLLSRYGRVESAPGFNDPLAVVELAPIALASGGVLRIGQLPWVKGEPVVEPGVYSMSASAVKPDDPLTLAVHDETDERRAFIVDGNGEEPLMDDLIEANDALRVLYEVSSEWIERHDALAVSNYPKIQAPKIDGYCLFHQSIVEAPDVFRPGQFA